MTIFEAEAGTLLAQLAVAAARTVVLVAIAGVLLATFRVKATSLKLFTWVIVLYAGLCMPLLGRLLPSISIPIPAGVSGAPTEVLKGPTGEMVVETQRQSTAHRALTIGGASSPLRNMPRTDRDVRSSLRAKGASVQWTTALLCGYLGIALFLFARLLTGFVFARRLVRSSAPIRDSRIAGRLILRARSLTVWCVPEVRESQSVSVPLTVGVFTHTILLPVTWREWDDDKVASVLTHEMSHVARWDCLTQYAALLHRAMFWFSPVSWWLNRHIIGLAEQASDEKALSHGTDQNKYARTLLGFLETVQASPGRVRWQGLSMAGSGRAEKRLQRVLAWRGDQKMTRRKSALIAVVALAIPALYLIAAARPGSPGQSAHVATVAQTQTAPASAKKPTSLNTPESELSSPSNSHAPKGVSTGAAATGDAASPTVQTPGESQDAANSEPEQAGERTHDHGFFYGYGNNDQQRFVIVSGKGNTVTMSGSGEDERHAEKLKRSIPGDFIWFERDEKSYVIRDQATVERARQFWAPQEELGKKQEALGKQQEALGKQQEELGKQMQAVRVKVPDMTAELDKLKAELKQLGPDASMEQIGGIQSEIGELQSKIGEIQSHAGDEQGKVGQEMGALGEKQGELGRQQGELGRQQGELAEKANQQMKQLLDDAIRKGIAQPENPGPSSGSL